MNDRLQMTDQAARHQALDPEQSWIVQAPAGSGKTGLLIQRYLLLLARVNEPEEVIAITFTRKAAAEMRERVLHALAQAGQSEMADDYAQRTDQLAVAVLRRDAERGWGILMNPSRLRIQTIDALCASLVRQMPVLSRFGSSLQITDDADSLYREAAQATIAQISSNSTVAQDARQLLVYLDNDTARIETLLVDMLAHRNHWLRHLYVRDRQGLEAGLIRLRQEAMDALQHIMLQWPTRIHEELVAVARYAAANLAVHNPASPVTACETMTGLPGNQESDAAVWQGIAEMLLTQKGEWRKKPTVDNGFPPDCDIGKAIAQSWKERVVVLIATLAGNAECGQRLHEIRSLPPATYTDAQWQILEAILRLLRHAVAELKLVFRSQGTVDHTEIAQAALHALGDVDTPTDLALSLDYGIRHLLVDEFQDTSVSQYELIRRLTAGWEPGDGRSLFVVGDPMQSVYRFREAEVGLFLHARIAGIGHIRLQPLTLSANFRSQQGIVDWVNTAFSTIMPAEENATTGAVPYSHSVAVHAALDGEAVSIHPFYRKNDPAEAATVVGLIRQIRLTRPQETVAVLVRGRPHLNDIVPLLKEAGLRFRALEIESLQRRQTVQDLYALTRTLIHLSDRTAWLAVLRAPWCGLLLPDIHALVSMQIPADSGQTIWERINDARCASMISADGYRRLSALREVMGECLRHRCRQPLRMTVEAAWRVLGGEACLDSTAEQEDATAYFDYLEAHETAGSVIGLAAFERGLARLYARPDPVADDTLQVMTIHKAKGLEFDHVIIPGLSRSPGHTGRKLLTWMERPRLGAVADSPQDSLDTDLLLAPVEETGADQDQVYAWLKKLEAKKETLESERLLYVAATRAKQRLHLLGMVELATNHDGDSSVRPPRTGSLLARLWPLACVQKSFYSPLAASGGFVPDNPGKDNNTDGVGKHQPDQLLRRITAGWALPVPLPGVVWQGSREKVKPQDDIEFSWAGETARVTGVIVHRWLQIIARSAMKDWYPARIEALHGIFKRQLQAWGVLRDDETGLAVRKVIAALVYSVTDVRGQWLLGPQQEAENELRLTAMVAGICTSLAIDRTFRDADGCYWVIDYKTSSHSGAGADAFLDREQQRYRVQLDRYAEVMRMTGKYPVKCGLYFPLLQSWREWRDDDPDHQQ